MHNTGTRIMHARTHTHMNQNTTREFKPIARYEIESYSGEARVQLLPHGADDKAPEPALETSSPSASAATRDSIAAGSAAGDIGSEGKNRNIK